MSRADLLILEVMIHLAEICAALWITCIRRSSGFFPDGKQQ